MASIQGIYVALFGRPADPDGLAYWNGQTKNGTDLSNLIGHMTQSGEYQTKYAGKSDVEVVTSIYQSLFGHAPDAAGLKFFVDGFANKTISLDTIAINILDGAKDSDLAIITNKIAAADAFTKSLDTPAEIAAYKGATALTNATAFLTKVTGDSSTVPSSADVDKAVSTVGSPSGGQGPTDGQGTGTGGGGGGSTPAAPTLFKLTGAAGDQTGGDHGHFSVDRAPLGSVSLANDPTDASNKVLAFKLGGAPDTANGVSYVGVGLKSTTDQALGADLGSHVTYKFYIDPNWTGDSAAQSSGIWVQMQNASQSLDKGGLYSIAEYMDKDAVAAAGLHGDVVPTSFTQGFRFWSSDTGWTYEASTSAKSGWVNLDFSFANGEHKWSVDGTTAYTDNSALTFQATEIDSIIVNSRNNGHTDSFLYDDIALVGTSHNPEISGA